MGQEAGAENDRVLTSLGYSRERKGKRYSLAARQQFARIIENDARPPGNGPASCSSWRRLPA